ncbi:hypothetical protein GGR54DRAFT_633254 [Hypoxylon sp. NC1633]|nr:hypothetical protein GGR54DRAFT_633254 [Hypoxylon sp. NC1633]
MAPVCKFWQQGHCRNGASCRFEHPSAGNTNPFGAPNSNTNRFNALVQGNGNNNSNNNLGGSRSQEMSYKLSKDSIRSDLTSECPSWILSCYAPARDGPEQLFGGNLREQSFEEVMLYIKNSGNEQQAVSEITALVQQAQQQTQTTLNNIEGAIQFILAAENSHPNRIDICKQSDSQGSTSGIFARDAATGPQAGFGNPLVSNPFSSPPQQPPQNPFSNSTSSFGQPSALGQRPNPFTSAPAVASSHQPSAIGAPKPMFGQASQMGAGAPAFGQPSSLGQKTNPFSSNTGPSGPSGFGQVTQSSFGQPSALGQRPSPFAASPASAKTSPFSQQATSAAGPFGNPAVTNPFSQATNPLADQAMDTSAPTPAANNPFGPPSTTPFTAAGNNPFGAQQSPGFGAAASNPFAQSQTQPQLQTQQDQKQATPAAKANPYGPNSKKQHPSLESYIIKAMNGRITSFNGQPVMYKWKVDDRYENSMPNGYANKDPPVPGVPNADGTWRKILFPDGPPSYNKDTEPDPVMYDGKVKAAYEAMTATGRFEGHMPEVPPMREDCVWNF